MQIINPTAGASSGHDIDEYTYCLWRCDEASHGATSYAQDAGFSGSILGQGTLTSIPRVSNGPVSGSYSRVINAGTLYQLTGSVATNGLDAAYLQGQWTCEFFFRTEQVPGSIGTILGYGASGETQVANLQMSVRINTSLKLDTLWEAGAGVNNQKTQTAGTGLTFGTWHHVAISKDTTNLMFYIDGVLQDTVAFVSQPDGGSSANWVIGGDGAGTVGAVGSISDIRISNIARSGSEISASAALKNTTAQHPVDANTVHMWRLQEAPDLIDTMGRVHMVCLDNSLTRPAESLVYSLTPYSKYCSVPANGLITPIFPNSASSDLATVLRGDFSMECWLRMEGSTGAVTRGIFYLSAPGETQAGNFFSVQLSYVSVANGYNALISWETGSGVNLSYTSANNTITYNEMIDFGVHFAVTKSVSASLGTFKFYTNGQLRDTSTALGNFDGTGAVANAVAQLGFGLTANWLGYIDDFRLSNKERTADEILASYNRGKGYPFVRT